VPCGGGGRCADAWLRLAWLRLAASELHIVPLYSDAGGVRSAELHASDSLRADDELSRYSRRSCAALRPPGRGAGALSGEGWSAPAVLRAGIG
jgi:hypothetical protein